MKIFKLLKYFPNSFELTLTTQPDVMYYWAHTVAMPSANSYLPGKLNSLMTSSLIDKSDNKSVSSLNSLASTSSTNGLHNSIHSAPVNETPFKFPISNRESEKEIFNEKEKKTDNIDLAKV